MLNGFILIVHLWTISVFFSEHNVECICLPIANKYAVCIIILECDLFHVLILSIFAFLLYHIEMPTLLPSIMFLLEYGVYLLLLILFSWACQVNHISFNPYNEWILATASSDTTIGLFDTRKLSTPLHVLSSHMYAS